MHCPVTANDKGVRKTVKIVLAFIFAGLFAKCFVLLVGTNEAVGMMAGERSDVECGWYVNRIAPPCYEIIIVCARLAKPS